MIDDGDTIEQARAAWSRIKSNGRKNFDDWCSIGRALIIGRSEALKFAASNRPVGSRYNAAMGAWLREAGLDGIVAQERYRAILIVENLPAVEMWRGSLDELQRRRLNHPNAIWHAWRRATKVTAAVMTAAAPRQAAASRSNANGGGYHKAVVFDQEMVRRVAVALRQNWCSDTMKLAIVALRAAIRDQDDIPALIPAPSPHRSNGKPHAVAELHA